jgi:hypothetical protein
MSKVESGFLFFGPLPQGALAEFHVLVQAQEAFLPGLTDREGSEGYLPGGRRPAGL